MIDGMLEPGNTIKKKIFEEHIFLNTASAGMILIPGRFFYSCVA